MVPEPEHWVPGLLEGEGKKSDSGGDSVGGATSCREDGKDWKYERMINELSRSI